MKSSPINIQIRDWLEEDLPFLLGYYQTLPGVTSDNIIKLEQGLKHNLQQPIKQKKAHYLMIVKDDHPFGFSLINDLRHDGSAAFHLHTVMQRFRDRGLLHRAKVVRHCLTRFQTMFQLSRFRFPIHPHNHLALNGTERFLAQQQISFQKSLIDFPPGPISPACKMVVYEFVYP